MNVIRRIFVLVVTAFTLGSAASVALAADDAASVRAGTESWIKAYNAGNADVIAALYADSAVVMPPGAPIARGRAAIRQFVVKDIANAKAAGVTLVLGSDNVVVVKGDVAWHSGDYTVKDKNGATVDSGAYMEAWRKSGGKWLIQRDIWNSSTPPPAPAPAPAAGPKK